jgi:hypothetical protein
MTHAWIVAFAICTLPTLCAAQEPEAGAKLGDATATAEAMDAGIGWLLRHQDENGGWSASQFMRHDPKTDLCTGTGKPDQDLLVTAWAAAALLSRGNTEEYGPHAEVVQKVFLWIEKQMQSDGFLGTREAPNSVVAHALLCSVLCEGRMVTEQPPPKSSLERLVALRLPDRTWPARVGETKGDAMATFYAGVACVIFNHLPISDARVDLEPSLVAMQKGVFATASLPSGEAMLRLFVLHDRTTDKRLAELMGALGNQLPQWRSGAEAARMDFLDWNLGTRAVLQMGGDLWDQWYAALQTALVVHQRTDGAHAGSWDPVDVRGKEGGRVYATAVNVCSLSLGHRIARIRGGGGPGKK